ncbi:ABC transporter ATP-binding protein [Aquipuribacter sp. SD81]|uniref:ABC transporter ATP-binding protein n=1 Tax=Aquipuribacter sp. SD81 TaxID=3127703 RepID=UPI003018BE48
MTVSADGVAAQSREGVTVERLHVRFGSVTAVDAVDLGVSPGQVLALVGGNGAGKSTTMRVVAGVVPATSGRVVVDGVDVSRDLLAAKQRTGYCPDVGGLLPRATPWEHLQLSAALRGLTGWEERAQHLLKRFELADVTDRVTAGFSHGMGRRMSVVLAGLHRPPVLLLDEPFDGVDPLGVEATFELVEDLTATGTAVLVSTHLLQLATEVANDAVVLRSGSVVGRLPVADLVGREGARRYRELLGS